MRLYRLLKSSIGTYVGTDSNPVTPSNPMHIPLKMDRAIACDPEGLACQFATRISLPVLAQCTTDVITRIKIVRHCTPRATVREVDDYHLDGFRLLTWKAQIPSVTLLLSRTPKSSNPVKPPRMMIVRTNAGKGKLISPLIY